MKTKFKLSKILISAVFVLFIFSLTVSLFALPKHAKSENEKRVLAKFPELTAESLKSGEFTADLDTYIADHFPLRDLFVGINAYAGVLMGQNGKSGIYKCSDGYLITEPAEFSETRITKNISAFSKFAQKSGLPSSMIVVPTAGRIMDSVLPKYHKQFRDDELFEIVSEKAVGIDLIDLRASFTAESEKSQLYYRTDHHLTSQGTLLMYGEFCKSRNLTPAGFELSKSVDGFYGTAYSKSGLWLTKPDSVEILKAVSGNSYRVTIDDGNNPQSYDDLYFESHLEKMDKYPVFLDGNHSLVRIENKDCRNGKRLLLIKDSYAHCFSTFLIENYEEICMIDLRYFRASVSELIASEKLNEILFLYGAENINSSTDIARLNLG